MLVSIAVVAASLTVTFLGMRAVMDIGGVCAEGATPFEISRPCPEGVPGLLMGGIWLGVIAAIVYVFAAGRARIPSLAGLLWPALFIALGFNFLQYAFDPPEGEGIVWGWLVPGVLFVLMGAVPLLFWLSMLRDRAKAEQVDAPTAVDVASLVSTLRTMRRTSPPPPPTPQDDLVDELERLDALRRSGALSESEYQKAKRRLLA